VSAVLALFASPDADAMATTEFLRVVAALRAVGVPVRLVEAGRGVGVLSESEPDLSTDGARYLAALREDGVAPERDANVGAAIESASALLLAPDPARAGTPAHVALARGARPGPGDVETILAAGQVTLG
jgi:hypothetical protein